jgi:hypothetical protein
MVSRTDASTLWVRLNGPHFLGAARSNRREQRSGRNALPPLGNYPSQSFGLAVKGARGSRHRFTRGTGLMSWGSQWCHPTVFRLESTPLEPEERRGVVFQYLAGHRLRDLALVGPVRHFVQRAEVR